MPRIIDLAQAGLRALIGTNGRLSSILDEHGNDMGAVTATTDSSGNVTGLSVGGNLYDYKYTPAKPSSANLSDLYSLSIVTTDLSIPNPYPSQASAPVHPAIIAFDNFWNGYKYWMAFTPYPAYNSIYENPCLVASQDLVTWVIKGRSPLIDKPANGYNADTHIFMSVDGLTMYMAYRERITAGNNSVMIIQSTDGTNWSSPRSVATGLVGTQDFACPSIFWNGSAWTMISHNLDAVSPWPVERRVSATSDIYSGFGSGTTVSISPPASRSWWHSYHQILQSGQIVALMQDNNGISGQPGNLYWAESGDGGLTYTTGRQIYLSGVSAYRSTFFLGLSNGNVLATVIAGDYGNLKLSMLTQQSGRAYSLSELNAVNLAILSGGANLPPGAVFADNFTRTDSAITLGTSSSGGSYSVLSGTWGISTNRAYPVASGKVTVETSTVDHTASVTFADITTAQQQWLIVRLVDTNNCWRCGVPTPTASGLQPVYLQGVSGGVVVSNTFLGMMNRGDILTLDAKGAVISVFVNGVKLADRLCNINTTGTKAGLQANAGANTFYKNFVCITSP